MAIDFSYLEGVAPQEESAPVMPDTANVTIRVDADSLLLCDGEYIDQPFKAGILTKIQLSPGQHLLEFLYTEDPDIKIEKEVDFPESGKSYLVLIKGLKELVDAVAEEARQKVEAAARAEIETEAKRKTEEKAKKEAEAEAEAKRKAEEAKMLKEKSGTINGHDYVDLGLPSGLKWATCNVGADSPEEYGDYYAWGEVKTKSEYTEENCKTYEKSIDNFYGEPTYDVARKKWGSSWRMPTYDELDELLSECKWQKTTQGGKNGYKVTGPNGNSIFLPAAGLREGASLNSEGQPNYWCTEPSVRFDGTTFAYRLCLFMYSLEVLDQARYYGLSVRPVSL